MSQKSKRPTSLPGMFLSVWFHLPLALGLSAAGVAWLQNVETEALVVLAGGSVLFAFGVAATRWSLQAPAEDGATADRRREVLESMAAAWQSSSTHSRQAGFGTPAQLET